VFTLARYIIVDDDAAELKQLSDSLQGIGAPCLPLHYNEVEGINCDHLQGVRLLFLDLHLTTGAQSSDTAYASGVIVDLLERGISSATGPYVIILWTKHQEQKEAFEAYVMKNLDSSKRPIAILSLDKNEYLAGNAGGKLTADVSRIIETDPRLRALLDWEREVLRAAGATLVEIGTLVAADDRIATRFSERLDEILSLIASEAVGEENAEADPYSAINAALMPILSDRIANQRIHPTSNAIWKAAVTKIAGVPQPSLAEAAKLNSMLHLAASGSEELKAGNWGAVTLLPEEGLEGLISGRFGVPVKPLLSGTFCISESVDRKASKLCVLRVGASCDYAQSRKGPIPFILGAIVPADAARREKGLPKAEIVTPPMIVEGFEKPIVIVFNTFFQITLVPADFEEWKPLCRLREPLLMQIATHGAQTATRPAIISFKPQT